jgi:hypothetical protein
MVIEAVLLQIDWFVGVVTTGVGSTITRKFCEVPGQPFAVGVTIIVAVSIIDIVSIAVNDMTLSAPVAISPIVVSLFVHV